MAGNDVWKYCTREQSRGFLFSLRLTGNMFQSEEQVLAFLYELSNHPERHYRKARIPKRSGGFRTLWIPDEKLAFVQRNILRHILEKRPVSECAAAYKKGCGLREHACKHVGQHTIVKLDIHDFFGHITWMQVYQKVFPGYLFPGEIRSLLTWLCCYRETVPQGAPTSPAISNLVMKSFDDYMEAWCGERKLTYTRYCDDLTFSGDMGPDALANAGMVIRKVSGYLEAMGFALNEKKTRVYTKGTRQEVTGVVVNEKTQVSAEYRKKLRQEWYYCKKYGVEEHLKRTKKEVGPEAYLHSLLGKVRYVVQINPEDQKFREYGDEIETYLSVLFNNG